MTSMTPRRRFVWLSTALLATLIVTAGALAYFASTGTNTAAAGAIGSIDPPTAVTAVMSGADVTVSWNAATRSSGDAVSGYRVVRSTARSSAAARPPYRP